MENELTFSERIEAWANNPNFAVFVPSYGEPSVIDLASGKYGDELATLQFAVQGLVETISVVSKSLGSLTMWVNESGITEGLAGNKIATDLFAVTYGHPSVSQIRGNAVLTLNAGENGELLGMTELQARSLAVTLRQTYGATLAKQ